MSNTSRTSEKSSDNTSNTINLNNFKIIKSCIYLVISYIPYLPMRRENYRSKRPVCDESISSCKLCHTWSLSVFPALETSLPAECQVWRLPLLLPTRTQCQGCRCQPAIFTQGSILKLHFYEHFMTRSIGFWQLYLCQFLTY